MSYIVYTKKRGFILVEQKKISPNKFLDFIEKKCISLEEIAECTGVCIRSVYRWENYGIPEFKFKLLSNKYGA